MYSPPKYKTFCSDWGNKLIFNTYNEFLSHVLTPQNTCCFNFLTNKKNDDELILDHGVYIDEDEYNEKVLCPFCDSHINTSEFSSHYTSFSPNRCTNISITGLCKCHLYNFFSNIYSSEFYQYIHPSQLPLFNTTFNQNHNHQFPQNTNALFAFKHRFICEFNNRYYGQIGHLLL